MTRVVSLGLDGAAWHKLDRLFDDGRLPNLQRLCRNGARAPLRSVLPPVTCPAWRCSTSGKNPGKLGVYWWLNLDRSTGAITTPDARSFGTADVWDYLADAGYACAVVNVPLTAPPAPANGVMVPGFGTPFREVNDEEEPGPVTDPPEFREELVEEYDWEVWVEDIDSEAGLERCYAQMRSRFELLADLAERGYDYLHLTLFLVNALQHKYGDGPETARAWELIDDYVGRIDLEDTLLVVYSDHGHAHIENTFVVNKWLAEEGHLSLRSESTDRIGDAIYSLLDGLGVSPRLADRLAERLLPEVAYDALVPSTYPISSVALARRVDWEASDAVATSQGPVYLNRERLGGEYEAFRERLRRRFESLEHGGESVIDAAHTAEDVYAGRHADTAPDLLLESAANWEIYGGIVPSVFEEQVTSWTSGNHPRGMILLAGEDVQPCRPDQRSLLDVMPTVLAYLGCDVPTDVDGEVFAEPFADGSLSVERRVPIESDGAAAAGVDAGLEARLTELGYLE